MSSQENQQQVLLGQNLISIRQFQMALAEKVPRFLCWFFKPMKIFLFINIY
jgi:hypothetical protein